MIEDLKEQGSLICRTVGERMWRAVGIVVAVLLALSACTARELPEIDDGVAPVVSVTSPRPGARVETATPSIEIEYSDTGSGISVPSFRARINGHDYSADFDHHSRGASGRISSSRPLPLGENRLVVEIVDRAGNVAQAQTSFVNAAGGWLEVMTVPGAAPRRDIEIVLDASGSMEKLSGATTRMAVATQAVNSVVAGLPEGTHLGLRVFRDCGDIASLVSIGAGDKGTFARLLEGIEPDGGTPIVASLIQSFDALSSVAKVERVAVLVTDGGESCGGDLQDAANRALDAATRVIIIGFDIERAGITEDLQALAESTGGAFYNALEPEELRDALEESVLQIGYVVYDKDGRQIAEGQVDGEPVELALGTYRVNLAMKPPITVDRVRIGSLTETTVELGQKGDQLATDVKTREKDGTEGTSR